jgi:hypothetical protein
LREGRGESGASLDEVHVAAIGRTPLLTVTPKDVRYPPSFSSSTSRAGEPLADTMPLTARSQTTRLMPGRFRQQPIDQGEPDEGDGSGTS